MFDKGMVVGGRYRLVKQIGEGGMATIWEAEHLTLGSPVAVKFLMPTGPHVDKLVERFMREARVAASVRHRNVVEIMDFGLLDDTTPYMVMELLKGESLAYKLEDGEPMDVTEAAYLAALILRGLAAVHDAGIVHRDLKPDNVFLIDDPDGIFPKLLDFGVSKRDQADTNITQEGVLVGTPDYMSPEQARGLREIDARTDVWAMGVMLWEMLTGRLPFESENVGDLIVMITTQDAPPIGRFRSDLPEELAAVIARALSKKKEKRFHDAREMRYHLMSACQDLGLGFGDPDSGVSFVSELPPAPALTPVEEKAEEKGEEEPEQPSNAAEKLAARRLETVVKDEEPSPPIPAKLLTPNPADVEARDKPDSTERSVKPPPPGVTILSRSKDAAEARAAAQNPAAAPRAAPKPAPKAVSFQKPTASRPAQKIKPIGTKAEAAAESAEPAMPPRPRQPTPTPGPRPIPEPAASPPTSTASTDSILPPPKRRWGLVILLTILAAGIGAGTAHWLDGGDIPLLPPADTITGDEPGTPWEPSTESLPADLLDAGTPDAGTTVRIAVVGLPEGATLRIDGVTVEGDEAQVPAGEHTYRVEAFVEDEVVWRTEHPGDVDGEYQVWERDGGVAGDEDEDDPSAESTGDEPPTMRRRNRRRPRRGRMRMMR